MDSHYKKGLLFALLAFSSWGVSPLYWKLLLNFSSWELMAHRVLWSALFYLLLLLVIRTKEQGKSQSFRLSSLKLAKSEVKWVGLAGLLIGFNWVAYIYAIHINAVLQGSLAYFITPLLNVLMGAMVFSEQLSARSKFSTGLASVGLLFVGLGLGQPPWLALFMAATFSIYALCKKKIKVRPLVSSFWESVLLVPLAVFILIAIYPFWMRQYEWLDIALLLGTGAVTGLPLLWFSISVQIVPLSSMAFLQFLSPSLQFLIGVLIFGEAFSGYQMAGYIIVWISIAIYLGRYRRVSS